jgi:hypothetical protein
MDSLGVVTALSVAVTVLLGATTYGFYTIQKLKEQSAVRICIMLK